MNGRQSNLENIDPTKIKLNDDKIENSIFRNARTTLNKEEMNSNRESIRTLGLLKPLIIRPIKNDPDGYPYQLVCGSRRLRNVLRLRQESLLIKKEGKTFQKKELCYQPETADFLPAYEVYANVKCFIRDCDDETAIAINIAENLEHSKLPEVDLMEFCQELVNLKNPNNTPRYSREKIAEMCNRHESWVSLTLELNRLPDKIKTMMFEDRVTRTAALAFLQTKKDKIHEVIEMGENLVRQEKLVEAKVIEEEIRIAETDLSDAQNDVFLYKMMDNQDLREIAERRETTQRKRVSAASEKRDATLKEAECPRLTGDIIQKANLLVPDAKKGKPKAMAVKDIRDLYVGFKKIIPDDPVLFGVINGIFEMILGHRASTDIQILTTEERNKTLPSAC